MSGSIIFDGASIRAILAGRKTQTRRVVKSPGAKLPGYDAHADEHLRCPYGQPGDLLWIRETFTLTRHGRAVYRADATDQGGARWPGITPGDPAGDVRWTSPIHMPRSSARLWLRVKGVRVERLQEITPEDALAEGITPDAEAHAGQDWREKVDRDFAERWDALNAKRGYAWESNPWVWRIEFERTEAPA